MMIPTLHSNGTSRKELLAGYEQAYDAVNAAITQVVQTCPNGRDYYPQAEGALREAQEEHEERIGKLRSVLSDLSTIWTEIEEQ